MSLEGGEKLSSFLDVFPAKASISLLRSLKRGTDAARTETNRLVAKDMGLKVGDVRKRTRTIPPTGASLAGEVRASLTRVPLIEFGKKKRPAQAFIATMPRSGHTGIYRRKSRRRLPIVELRGASVGHSAAGHVKEILARGWERSQSELNRQLDRLLR